jgi:aminopeptidase YwaD
MKHLYFPLLLVLCLVSVAIHGQDRNYVHQLVSKLSAPQMHGRGYVKDGDKKAAKLLFTEMQQIGLKSFGDDYYQHYSFSVNTFPSKMRVSIDGKRLTPGRDFTVSPRIQTTKGRFELVWLPDTITKLESAVQLIDTIAMKDKLIVLPSGMQRVFRRGLAGVSGIIIPIEGNPWWFGAGARNPDGKVNIMVQADKLPQGAKEIQLDIVAEYVDEHITQNLIGYIPGQAEPDSFYVFIAHYDHLGRMGRRTYFPGANDNASGVATVLDLARYYAANPEKAYYTMVFILVSGEEVGLVGSFYNADNPLFPLDKIKFLINFDMVGTGSAGLSVVNGLQFPVAFALMDSLNTSGNYFPDLRAGGESCNSDHCAYYRKGVPSFFLFTRGPENREYHNIYDTPNRLPFTKYEELIYLVTDFVAAQQP